MYVLHTRPGHARHISFFYVGDAATSERNVLFVKKNDVVDHSCW